MALLNKILTLGDNRQLKKYRAVVDKINDLEPEMEEKSDEELKAYSQSLQEKVQGGEAADKLLTQAFALVREASRRAIGMRHFDVQLIGAMALNDGCIAEMKTGEGKTLVSTAAGYLNALNGQNVHVVTVNDYLARRDAEWMGQIYEFLGMRAGVILNQMPEARRRESYRANVTYGTNSEFGFDYLRDNMVSRAERRVQRGQNFAIVDEVDSILIDEARTPLIISGLGVEAASEYQRFALVVPLLTEEEDYILDEKKRIVYTTELGLDRIEAMLGMEIYADITGRMANHLKQALRAEFLFHKDIDYIVTKGEVKIVDEFTGRVMEGRRWSEGLHQAVEAKEHVKINPETHTMATITLQNYYRLYKKLSGMTGTALTEDSEFRQIYHLPVIPVPTNKPMIREDKTDFVFRTKRGKFKAVADEVEERHKTNQPILVGTTSIEASEGLSKILQQRKIPHNVLNAKNPEREAAIVAQAGRAGAVTIATNMAGRGTDITLGGNKKALTQENLRKMGANPVSPDPVKLHAAEQHAERSIEFEGYVARFAGGLYVIGTERHESRRIDNQLRGRSGRQGDPGESRFYLSLEDNLLRRFGGERLDAVAKLMQKQGIAEDEPLEAALVSKVIDTAQHEVETANFAARKHVLEYDDVMDLQRKAVYNERNAILDGKDVEAKLPEVIDDVVQMALDYYCADGIPVDDWDMEGLRAWYVDLTGEDNLDLTEIIDEDDDSEVLRDVLAEQFASIIDEKRSAVGEEHFHELTKLIMLQIMDNSWIQHLQEMDYLKTGVGLRAFGQLDPVTEYKEAAYDAFEDLTVDIYHDFLSMLLHMPTAQPDDLIISEEDRAMNPDKMIYEHAASGVSPSDDKDAKQGNPLA